MKILSIETSCDETGIALLDIMGDLDNLDIKIEEKALATQIETHRPWGGVVPTLARREHDKNLPELFSNLSPKTYHLSPDIVAVTVGPGLDPCLWSGINFAKDIHEKHFPESELVGVNHMEGHLFSFLLQEKTKDSRFNIQDLRKLFPAVQLVVSGGHTMLVLMRSLTDWEVLGQTKDDASGEAFDKVARMLGLPYPGGPEISRLAEDGDPQAIDFPRPMIGSDDYSFSFSGLKTAVLYYLRKNPNLLTYEVNRLNIAASFQQAAIDVLVKKTMRAAEECGAKSIMLSGGVAANNLLRKTFKTHASKLNANFLSAPTKYQTDNAVIIGVASYINHLSNKKYKLKSQPNLSL